MGNTNHTPDHLSTEEFDQNQDKNQDQAHSPTTSSKQPSAQLTVSMNKELVMLELLTFPVTLIVMGWLFLKFSEGTDFTGIHPLLSINPTTNAIAVIALLVIIGKAVMSFKIRQKYRRLQQ